MESNRWAICINLNNLKKFDDLFENKEEIVSQTGTDYNNFFPSMKIILSIPKKFGGDKSVAHYKI